MGENQSRQRAPKLPIGSVADDYTGATDLANSFAREGLRTIQTIGVPREGLVPDDVEAIVVALKSRSIRAQEAVAQSLDAYRWLVERGVGHVLFKICSTFDSTDAGNIGPVTEALRKESGAGVAIVCPAFPGAGRTVYQGHLFVGDRLLSESPLRDHPLNPMRDPDLVRVMQRQSRGDIGLVPFSVVDQGPDAVKARISELGRVGAVAAIADAITMQHLETLGESALMEPLSTGGSGLGAGLARALVRKGLSSGAGGDALQRVDGRPAALAGSCSAATLGQIAQARAQGMSVLQIDPASAIADAGEALAAIERWLAEQSGDAPILIATSAAPDVVAAVQSRFGREEAGRALESLLAEAALLLMSRGFRRLVVAGGETSGAVTDALGIEALLIGPEIAPGVPVTTGLGHASGPIGLVLKSGNFGDKDFFAKAFEAMA